MVDVDTIDITIVKSLPIIHKFISTQSNMSNAPGMVL